MSLRSAGFVTLGPKQYEFGLGKRCCPSFPRKLPNIVGTIRQSNHRVRLSLRDSLQRHVLFLVLQRKSPVKFCFPLIFYECGYHGDGDFVNTSGHYLVER